MRLGASPQRRAVGVFFLLVVIFALAGCAGSPQARRDKFLARGKDYYQKQNYTRAILEFKNANQAKPDDPEVFYQLGMAYAALNDLRPAVAAFRKTLELDPKHTGAQLRLAELMAAASNPSVLADAESRLEKLVQNAADAETLNTLAITQMKLGKLESAVETLERALDDFRGGLNSTVLLARVKWDQKDFKGAEAALRKACKEQPKSAYAHRLLGEFYAVRMRLPEAEPELRLSIQLDPAGGLALFDLARLQLTQGKKQDAEQTFRQLAGKEGYKPIYGAFLFRDGRREDAIHEFEKVAQANPGDRQARAYLLAAYQTVNRPADAEKALTEALKKNPRDADALFQRGEILLREAKYDRAEADINSLAKISPEAPESHYLRAQLQKGRGADRAYRQELTEALRISPGLIDLRIELAQDLVQSHDGQAALAVLDAAQQSQKKALNFMVTRNWALWAKSDLPEMRKGIDAGLAQERNSELVLQDGLWKLRSGNARAARSALEEVLDLDPTNVLALQGLNTTYILLKDQSAGVQKVKAYAAQALHSAPIQNFLANLLLASGELNQARKAFAAAKAADPKFTEADLGLIRADYAEHKYDDAEAKLKTLLSAEPGNLTALKQMGIIEETKGNYQPSIDYLRKALVAKPDDTEASNNLAYLLAEHGNSLDEALKFAQKAVELAPNRLEYSDTMGWILYRKGLHSQAIKYLEKSGADPHNALWKYHLAMAYAKLGDRPRSHSTLDAAVRLNPNLPEAKVAKEVVGPSR